MDGRCLIRGIFAGTVLGALFYQPDVLAQDHVQEPLIEQTPAVTHVHEEPGHIHDLINSVRGYVDPENAEIISVHQLACLIDHLDESLFYRGQIVVKAPDVWGQNRLTAHRSDYESQMKALGTNFEVILNGFSRVADSAALTSATSIGAFLAAPTAQGAPASTATSSTARAPTTTSSGSPAPVTIPSATGLIGSSGLVANANSLLPTQTPLLLNTGVSGLVLGNKNSSTGIGLESSVLADERSAYLQHLYQMRRVNAGDDRSDLPGYGMYLVRTPVSILPGAQSVKGKGAMVTVEAKHQLTPDLLANTFRNVVIIDTAYQLMDVVTRGQYLPTSDDEPCDCEKDPTKRVPPNCAPSQAKTPSTSPQPTNVPAAPASPTRKMILEAGGRAMILPAGGRSGGQTTSASTDVVAIYGADNLRKLVCAVKDDQLSWYRHDPSIVSWLLSELSSAHSYMRERARNGDPLFQPNVFENIGSLALMRDFKALEFHREQWLKAVSTSRNEAPRVRPVDVLAYALMVQSVYVDRQLKSDMQIISQRKGCACGDPYQYLFHALWPDEAAQHAFMTYVECKWPIHVFSLDPIVDQQNQLDLYSARSQLQLALALAISSGTVSVQNATTYARSLEQDMEQIALNKTAVGFGAGETTYGWRFYPRVQTPPRQNTPARIGGLLLTGGPGRNYSLKNRLIEPGQRDCYALVVVPNFIPAMRLTSATNFFDLTTSHPKQEMETTDVVHLGRKLQVARNAMQRLCDSSQYRPADLELLNDRLTQLEALLPMQSHRVLLPNEADLSGSEIFTSTNVGLAPRLLTWYGEPASAGGSSIFIMGSGFKVDGMKIIVGGQTLGDPGSAAPSYDIISRNVIRIDIPKGAATNLTPVFYKDANCANIQRAVIDVHVATPNGISNHLLIEVPPPPCPSAGGAGDKTISTTVSTLTKPNATDGSTQTTTTITTTPPGIVLPPGTLLPMGTTLPSGGTFVAPGAATVNGIPSAYPAGSVPSNFYQPMPAPTPPSTPSKPGGTPTSAVTPKADTMSKPSLPTLPVITTGAVSSTGRGTITIPPPAALGLTRPNFSDRRPSGPTPAMLDQGVLPASTSGQRVPARPVQTPAAVSSPGESSAKTTAPGTSSRKSLMSQIFNRDH